VIVRTLGDGTAFVIAQEAHADVAAQFAAHWGNDRFERLTPRDSLLFATIYHDSGHREMEADLPIDPARGLPYTFRGAPPEVRHREADAANVEWMARRDPYAAVLVQAHHTGLRKARYETVRARYENSEPRPPSEHLPTGPDAAIADLPEPLQSVARETGIAGQAADHFWHNYRALQVFDLLSLHLCCDGYDGLALRDVTIEGAPTRYGTHEEQPLVLRFLSGEAIRVTPFPFDNPELTIAVPARLVQPRAGVSPAREEYHQARRVLLEWTITP
jgi:hypothetical protein